MQKMRVLYAEDDMVRDFPQYGSVAGHAVPHYFTHRSFLPDACADYHPGILERPGV